MPLSALLLLLGSACLHVTWNLLLKQTREKYIANWWAALLGSAVFLPFLFFTGLPASQVWGLLLLSVVAETAYYITLSAAYRDADFSLVYPIARGTAPVMIALWAALFLKEQITPTGFLGLAIIVAGLLMLGSSLVLAAVRLGRPPQWRGIGLAFLLAFFISIYSTIDGAAVKLTAALPYTILVFFLSPVLSAPLVFRIYGWQTLKEDLVRAKFRLGAIGLLTVCAYLMVLSAYSIAKVSYSGAIREVSVILGALAGWLFLGERMGSLRVTGSLVMFIGILLIALSG